MSTHTEGPPPPHPMFASYTQLAGSLITGLSGIGLLDHDLHLQACADCMDGEAIVRWVGEQQWLDIGERKPVACHRGEDRWLVAIPLSQADGTLLGVFCAQQTRSDAPVHLATYVDFICAALRPLLECVRREMAASAPAKTRVQVMTQRTNELEWLFQITSNLKSSADDRHVVEELIDVSTKRLGGAFGVLCIPNKRLTVDRLVDPGQAANFPLAWEQTKAQLLAWVQRQNRPLVMNGAGRAGDKLIRCKILAVPVVRDSGGVIGVLAFYNPPSAPDFIERHVFLARHLGRQAASIADTQFDLMTGLYTRGGLAQIYALAAAHSPALDRSILYIDIDHQHVVNELHGFAVGNELIVRVADLLSPPCVPEGGIAARISADRFVIVLPSGNINEAVGLGEQIRAAAKALVIGPANDTVEVSVSCGVAALVEMPEGLERGIAAAELACKTAKNRGRNRVEVYACEDNTMMRRRDDVIAIGQLRAALKSDRLVLFAQPIVPLRGRGLSGGYEILLRLRNEDGELVSPGPLIDAAQRYQLLPTVDRWVTQRALDILAPYRTLLSSSGIGMALNVSGQSIGDANFMSHLVELIKAARLPADCITIEITEQAAVTHLARANQLIRDLKSVGCQIALDDFGTGSNTFTYLKNLQISKVKIDGSFVRDVATDRNSRATVRALVELAAGLSIDTVAEYVETQEIAEEVRAIGVDYGQGYAFGKPEPLEALLASLDQDESRRQRRLFVEN